MRLARCFERFVATLLCVLLETRLVTKYSLKMAGTSNGLFEAGDMFNFGPGIPLPNHNMPELDAIIFGEFESGLPEIDLDDSEDFLLTNAQQNERFGLAVSDADVIPEKTRRQTSWTMSLFQSWCNARGEQNDVVAMDPGILQQKLCRFIMEARRQDGGPYPAQTLYSIVTGIQRFLRESGRYDFLNNADPTFGHFRQALDATMKELTSEGVGTVPRRAEPISKDQEELLWSKGVFDINSAQGLTYLVFFYNCKLFGLRGGDEHRQLCRDQFSVSYDTVGRYLRFMGRSSKNVKGGLRQKDVAVKDLKIYAQPHLGEPCLVDIYNILVLFHLMVPFTASLLAVTLPSLTPNALGKTSWQG